MKRRIREPTAMQATQIDAEIDSSLLTTVNFMLSRHFLQLFSERQSLVSRQFQKMLVRGD